MKENTQSEKSVVIRSLIFKFLERAGYQGIAFVVQIVLARLLDPSDYGMLTLLTVFISVSQVFVQSGLNTALIQRKDIKESDYSSIFYISLLIAVVLYIILFFTAPFIAAFYRMPELKSVLRVLALVLIPGAFNSIQNAKVAREMRFKELMYCTIGSVVISGTVGIVMAYMGLGVWALVAQQLSSRVAICILLLTIVKWRPQRVLEWDRVGALFSFGWKLMVSALIDVIFRELQSLVIGRKYKAEMLGYYNRGKQFPDIIINNVNGSIQSVMLPALSKHNGDSAKIKSMMRRSIVTSSFLIFPICTGLAVIARPMVHLLLTDKWMPCVPYLQAYCFVYAFWPIHTANLQALNAQGRSGIFLILELIKKSYAIIILLITVLCFNTPLAIVLGQCCSTVLSCFVNAAPNNKLLRYGYGEQMHDILPSFLLSAVMGAAVYSINLLGLSDVLTLSLQIPLGVAVYVGLAKLLKLECFDYIISMLSKMKKKRNQKVKKLLLLGGSAQQVVAIETAKRLGYYTVLCDYLPDNPGQHHADKFYLVSTTDREAVFKVAEEEKIDGIIAYSSDPAAPTAAFVAEKLGLPTNPFSAVDILCNKDKFRKFLADNGFDCPKAEGFTDRQAALDALTSPDAEYPLIIKPTDSSGSKGVTIMRSTEGLEEAIDFAFSFSRCGEIIAETFIEKKHPYLIGGDIFVYNGRVEVWGLMNCFRENAQFPLVPSGKIFPVMLEEADLQRVKDVLQGIVTKLGIVSGSMNVELVIDKNDKVYPIDIGPRAGGNMIPIQLSHIFGIDIVEMSVKCAMGEPLAGRVEVKLPYCATYVLHSDRDGIYRDIEFSETIENHIFKKCLYDKPGDKVEHFDNAAKALGIIFLSFDSQDEMYEIMNNMKDHIKVVLD